MKKIHSRMLAISAAVVSACFGVYLLLNSFSNSLVFFYSPSELMKGGDTSHTIRIGGLVESGISSEGNHLEFSITDGSHSVRVTHDGIAPPMFREGQGIVAEGKWDGAMFHSSNLLTKHDESYMPPEVTKALKEGGMWNDGKEAPATEEPQ